MKLAIELQTSIVFTYLQWQTLVQSYPEILRFSLSILPSTSLCRAILYSILLLDHPLSAPVRLRWLAYTGISLCTVLALECVDVSTEGGLQKYDNFRTAVRHDGMQKNEQIKTDMNIQNQIKNVLIGLFSIHNLKCHIQYILEQTHVRVWPTFISKIIITN